MEGHKYMVRNLEHLLCKRLEELGLFGEEREGILLLQINILKVSVKRMLQDFSVVCSDRMRSNYHKLRHR